jgi:hypothetical protein
MLPNKNNLEDMIEKSIAIYTIIDDLLKEMNHYEPETRKVSDSEIITTALISAFYFGGNQEKGIGFMRSGGHIPSMLSKSRFNRRLHMIRELVVELFFKLASMIKSLNINSEYIIDSFPVKVCDNMRIVNSKLVQGKIYRGRKATMHRWFYGYNVHVMVTTDGIPVEYTFLPGSKHDSEALKQLPFDLKQGSRVYADSGYTNYKIEDMLKEADDISLLVARKSNSKRKKEAYEEYVIGIMRKRIETTFSEISTLLPKKIHAVTDNGFILKVIMFLFSYSLNRITD